MAKDIIHYPVKKALVKDGWTITHDPYTIRYGEDRTFVDLAAERLSISSQAIAAQRAGRKIMVEVKSFTGRSAIRDFEEAFGQYMVYLSLLAELAPEYKLYLAISDKSYLTQFQGDIIQFMVQKHKIPLIVVNIASEEIVKWIN